MGIPPDVVSRIAALARLSFDEEESHALRAELGRMLEYFGQIAQVPTEGIEPTAHVVPLAGSLRDDEAVRDPLMGTAEDFLRLAVESDPPFFRVPRFRQG